MSRKIHLTLERARSGQPTLCVRVDGTQHWIHSPRDPEAEAKVLVDQWWQGPGLYIVLGLGLGYHVSELERRLRATRGDIVVLEPVQEIYDIALSSGTLSALVGGRKVQLYAGAQARQALQARDLLVESTSVFLRVHPVLHGLFREEYDTVLDSLRGEVNRQVVNANTLLFWDLLWLRNTILNVPFLVSHPSGIHLQSRFKGVPAFIVAAGPSLDKNVRELKRAQGRSVILVVDTALRSVLGAGITPDFIVAVDASPKNYEHFRGVSVDGIPLVFDPMVQPAILDNHKGAKVSVRTYNLVYEWLSCVLEKPLQLNAGGSVATVALDFAVKLGCNPIVLVGQDLAYDDQGRTHAADSVYGKDRVALDQSSLLTVPGIDGGEVWTSRGLYSFLVWFERYLEAAPSTLRVIDATEGGARIRGTHVETLARTVDNECRTNVSASAIMDEAFKEWTPVTTVRKVRQFILDGAEALDNMACQARDGQKHVKELRRLVQRNRLQSRQAAKLLRQLATLNSSLRAIQEETQGIIHAALYRSILQAVRQDDAGTPAPQPGMYNPDVAVGLLSKSEQLYQAIESACRRTASVIRESLPGDGYGEEMMM